MSIEIFRQEPQPTDLLIKQINITDEDGDQLTVRQSVMGHFAIVDIVEHSSARSSEVFVSREDAQELITALQDALNRGWA